jgi:uncharacterized membrane protein
VPPQPQPASYGQGQNQPFGPPQAFQQRPPYGPPEDDQRNRDHRNHDQRDHDHGHDHQDHDDLDDIEDDDWDDEDDEDTPPPPRTGHGHSHGHSHGGGPKLEVSARTRRVVLAILIPAAIATAVAMIALWPGKLNLPDQSGNDTIAAYGNVTSITTEPCPPNTTGAVALGPTACGTAVIHLTDGQGANTDVSVDLPNGPGAPTLKTGDAVVLTDNKDPATGRDVYTVVDHQRSKSLLFMLAIAGAFILLVGGWRGLTAILALVVSFVLLLLFVIPAILNGESPLLVAVVGAIAVMFAVLYLTHGFNVHTSVAILGTLLSLILTGLLGYFFTVLTQLTGFGSEESVYLTISLGQVDVRGLLLAGIIIGALGVLDDVTITQSSTVEELAVTAKSRIELYRAATRVGRNHIASAVNTIIMAYAGASLPLLLLIVAGGRSAGQVVTSELIAQEIVRSVVGTIGLVASVPITTGLATLVADIGGRRKRQVSDRRRPRTA